MNNVLVNSLYDFSITLTYELHDSGDVNYVKYVEGYCNEHGIVDTYKKTFEDYCKYYLKENKGWFSDKEEVADWYLNYKKVTA